MTRGFLDNLPWKLLSVIIAFALWTVYVGEQEIATTTSVALQYRNLPPDLEISSDIADRVYLKVRGPKNRLTAAALGNAALILDLANVAQPGEQTFTLGASNVALPSGVKLERVVPSQVRLQFDRRVTREVPVVVRFAGPPPPGYRIARQSVWPQTLRIVGPESRIESVESAQTDSIDLGKTYGEAEFRVPVYLADPQVHLEKESPVVVRVLVEKNQPKEN